MKIGIFGGAFNPPHKMHQGIALELLKQQYLDKIIYVPTGNNYSKPGLLSGEDRIAMLNIMFQEENRVSVSDFEVQGSLYTINTLRHFREMYLEDEIYFICGTDNFAEFYTWRNYEEILKNYKLLVIARKDNEFHDIIKTYSEYQENIVLANIESQIISSSQIRKEILENGFTEKLKEYLDKKVIDYLKEINILETWQQNF